MAERLDEYMNELQGSLRKRFDADSASVIRAEVEAHLRDRIAAFEELGSSPAQAEVDAIRLFGNAKRFTVEMAEAKRPSKGPVVVVALVASVLMALLWPIAMLNIQSSFSLLAMLVFLIVMLLAIAATSFRARRLAPISMAGAALGALLLFNLWLNFLFVNLQPYGGFVYRFDRAAVVRNRDLLSSQDMLLSQIDSDASALKASPNWLEEANALGLVQGDQVLAPALTTAENGMGIVELRAGDAQEGKRRWADSPELVAQVRPTHDAIDGDVRAFDEATRRPFLETYLASLQSVFVDGFATWYLALMIPNVMGALLGMIVHAIRKRRSRADDRPFA